VTVIVAPYYAANVGKEKYVVNGYGISLPLPVINARECMLLCTTVL